MAYKFYQLVSQEFLRSLIKIYIFNSSQQKIDSNLSKISNFRKNDADTHGFIQFIKQSR